MKRFLLFTACLFSSNLFAAVIPCDQNEILVIAKNKKLYLCENSQAIKKYSVALGRGGLNKMIEGDRKTPVGVYQLNEPRFSYRFGTFIPIGYPNADQIAAGCTGKDVGIHGPHRRFQWLGRLNTWINWTAGCIALPSDGDIAQIAMWVNTHQPTRVRIIYNS